MTSIVVYIFLNILYLYNIICQNNPPSVVPANLVAGGLCDNDCPIEIFKNIFDASLSAATSPCTGANSLEYSYTFAQANFPYTSDQLNALVLKLKAVPSPSPVDKLVSLIQDSIFYTRLDLQTCKLITDRAPTLPQLQKEAFSYLNLMCPDCVRRFATSSICQIKKVTTLPISGNLKPEMKQQIKNSVKKYLTDNPLPKGPLNLDDISKKIMDSILILTNFDTLRGAPDVRNSLIFCQIRQETKAHIKDLYKQVEFSPASIVIICLLLVICLLLFGHIMWKRR